MTKFKFCGLQREADVIAVNAIEPDYVGFVFVSDRRRFIAPAKAAELKAMLKSTIKAVGVFIDEKPELVAQLMEQGVIDIAQLHGSENEEYLQKLRCLTSKPLIKAFQIHDAADIEVVEKCSADYVLLDSGTGTGKTFDWQLIDSIKRPYFLAGGLNINNIEEALSRFKPFAVDVSSGIETDGVKDEEKMTAFAAIVRK